MTGNPWDNDATVATPDTSAAPAPAPAATADIPSAEPWGTDTQTQKPAAWVMRPGTPKDQDLVSENQGFGYEVGRGATFDLINKLGKPQVAQDYENQHPLTAAGARFAGAAIPAMAISKLPLSWLQEGATLGQSAAANAGIGSAVGAAAGYGDSTDNPLRDTAMGAVTGGVLGAATPLMTEISRPVVQGLTARLSDDAASRMAFNEVRRRYLQDVSAGGQSASDMAQTLATTPDKPLGIADVAGANLSGLAGTISRTPGVGKEAASNFFTTRDVNTVPRLLDDIDRHVSSGGDAYTAAKAISNLQRQRSAPLYDAAYNAPPLNPDHIAPGGDLDQMMSRPSMAQAAQRALSLAKEEGRNPASLGLTFNVAGDPVFENVPSWQTLDYLKRGLDDTLNANRNEFGVLKRDEYVNALDDTRRQYLSFLDNNNPAYAAARKEWGGFSQIQSAMQLGQNFKNYRPELIADQVSQMTPAERQASLVGVADTMRKDVLSAAGNSDESKRLINSAVDAPVPSWREQQLQPFFPDQATYKKFVNSVLAERRMFETKTKTMGNSATADRSAEDNEGAAPSIGSSLLQLGTGALAFAHEPYAAIPSVTRGTKGIIGALREPSPAINEQAASMLFNPDQLANQQMLQRLEKPKTGTPLAPRLTPGIVELLGGAPSNFVGSWNGIRGRSGP